MRNVVMLAQKSGSDVTLGELITRYMRMRAISKPYGESALATMNRIIGMDIAKKAAAHLDSSDIVAMAQTLREGTAERDPISAATVKQYISLIRGPLRYAAVGWGMKDVSEKPVLDAKPLLYQLQLAGKSRPRSRRPEQWEWNGLHGHFVKQDPHCEIKMVPIMEFAVGSLRRRGEIVRLRWEDYEDTDRPMATVRDMKDPKFKIGNHHRFPLLFGTADIIRSMPMVNECIFPWMGTSVGKRFIEAKKVLGIVDLRFHDLRREGICRMLELGYSPAQVAAVSGHKNWNTLARVYGASTKPEDVHDGPAGARLVRTETIHDGPADAPRSREEAQVEMEKLQEVIGDGEDGEE